MKKRSNKLAPVASHALTKEQEAARTFAEAQQRVTDCEQQIQQLKAFREEYLLKYQQASQGMASMSQLLDYQAFLAKLSSGIGQANQTMALCIQQREILKQQWIQRRSRRQAIDSVVEKYQKKEQQQLAALEQKEMEEFSVQRFYFKHN